MPLIQILIALVLVGAALYLVTLIPMDAWMRTAIRVVVIVAVLIWLLSLFGFLVPWQVGRMPR